MGVTIGFIAHGFVNIISDAPRAHLILRGLKKDRKGSTPQVTGSSRLKVI